MSSAGSGKTELEKKAITFHYDVGKLWDIVKLKEGRKEDATFQMRFDFCAPNTHGAALIPCDRGPLNLRQRKEIT